MLLTTDEMEQDPVSFGQRRSQMKPSHANPEWFPWPDKAVSFNVTFDTAELICLV